MPLTDEQTLLGPDLVALHTSGHTPGVVSYCWTNSTDEKRYLFTGDSLTNFTIDRIQSVLGFHSYEGNTADFQRSLTKLRDLDRQHERSLSGAPRGTAEDLRAERLGRG